MDSLMNSLLPGYGAVVVVLAIILVGVVARRSKLPLPPAPKGYPVIGNLLDFAGDTFHIKARDISRQLGDDVISFNYLGKTTVVLNSLQAVQDLFDKKGSNYMDRPEMPMIVDLMGWSWTVALMRYGPTWKEHRKVFHGNFNDMESVINYQHIQGPVVNELLVRLLRSPDDFQQHIRLHAASVIMKRVYGHRVVDINDPFVTLADDASRSTSAAAVPGAFLVDLFPSLKYIPEWIPGAGFKKQAREWSKLSSGMVDTPYNMVKDKMVKGKAEPCFVSKCLEQNTYAPSDALSEYVIKSVAAVAYAGGADTSVSVITTFVLAMTLSPEAQKRAQIEIDSVTGGDRMPTFTDRPNLPFVSAVLKETLRWIPVLPLALPHRTSKDDQYKGYHIPANSTVLGNAWAILHDERVFSDPESFKPERFIENPSLPDPADIGVFGFGRRACAGKNMALDTIWIAMASILAVFDISKAIDKDGKVITPVVALEPGGISHPAHFKNKIVPRSDAAMALLQQGPA